jgi:hypothetical protein
VTNAQVRTGVGLLVLAIIGLVLAIAEGVSVLREAGVLARRVPAAEPGEVRLAAREGPAASTGDLDRALISLASTLAADLDRNRRPGASEAARSVEVRGED